MNEQLLKMNGLSVKILDMLSFESHLGMGYEFTTENIGIYRGGHPQAARGGGRPCSPLLGRRPA